MHPFLGINANQGGSFKDYFLENNVPEKIAFLKKNLDPKSCKIIDKCLYRILHFPLMTYNHIFFVDFDLFLQQFETNEEKLFRQIYEFNKKSYSEMFNLDGEAYNPDVFLFHHGLKFQNNKIKEYIKDKDFIDAGAYIGDSALILHKFYNPNKVYSFELSKLNTEKYLHIMSINNINDNSCIIINKGISDSTTLLQFQDIAGQGNSLYSIGNDKIEVIKIDDFVSTKEILNVGFIKCDVEGHGLKALRGMTETIKKYRPVLSLAIYHNPEEFFETKPALETIVSGLQYRITVLHCHPFCDFLAEVILFAYPEELHAPVDLEEIIANIQLHNTGKQLIDLFF